MSSPRDPSDVSAPAAVDVDGELTPDELAAQWEAEAPPSAGPTANLVSSLVVLALGVVGMLGSVSLGLGTPSHPRPGMWPFLVTLLIAVLALAQLFIGRRGGVDGEKFSNLSWLAGIGFVTLLVMVGLMPLIGFEVPALLLCLVWMKFLGGESWRGTILYSLLVVAAFYAIFILALGTSIPHLF